MHDTGPPVGTIAERPMVRLNNSALLIVLCILGASPTCARSDDGDAKRATLPDTDCEVDLSLQHALRKSSFTSRRYMRTRPRTRR